MNLVNNKLVLVGLNHKTAPVKLRECLAFTRDDAVQSLNQLKKHPEMDEIMIFSTCNRVEFLMACRDSGKAVEAIKAHILKVKELIPEKYKDSLYILKNEDAVRHLFNVAASLDSMVVGEPQILGQIKEAYRLAADNKATGVLLNRLLHRAFFVAKKVRSETGIGGRAVSISYAATELAKKIFGDLEGKKVLLIGAGEMAELAVEHLIRHRAGKIYVANRTFRRGLDLAERFHGNAISMEEIPASFKEVDIIISSTGSPTYVVKPGEVKASMKKRRNRPVFFIDIAVPRDIDPAVNRLNNVYVYDIDDLQGVIQENLGERKQEAVKGARIIDEAVVKFIDWHSSLDVVPTIKALHRKFNDIAEAEVKKTLHSLKGISKNQQEATIRLAESMINKILHDPTIYLKKNGQNNMENKDAYLDMIRKLFKLDE